MQSSIPSNDMAPIPDEREARIAELENQLQLSNANAILQDPEARNEADALLEKFQKGLLTYKQFKLLAPSVQKLYKRIHGYRPASGQEIKRKDNAAARTKRQNKQARKSRRANRG